LINTVVGLEERRLPGFQGDGTPIVMDSITQTAWRAKEM